MVNVVHLETGPFQEHIYGTNNMLLNWEALPFRYLLNSPWTFWPISNSSPCSFKVNSKCSSAGLFIPTVQLTYTNEISHSILYSQSLPFVFFFVEIHISWVSCLDLVFHNMDCVHTFKIYFCLNLHLIQLSCKTPADYNLNLETNSNVAASCWML